MRQVQIPEFQNLLDRICRNAADLLRANAASIYLRDGEEFVMRAGFGYPRDLRGVARYKPGEGITGWIALGNEFQAGSREEVERHFSHRGKHDKELWGGSPFFCWSLVGLPIRLGDSVVGLIKVENKGDTGQPCQFSKDDLENLRIYVRTISDTIRSNEDLRNWLLDAFFVFVLIPFQEKFRNVYHIGIKQTIEGLGMSCAKVDEMEFNDDILVKIRECIRKADIVVAELTDMNPNVFYETGYAHAHDKPTIHLAQTAKDIPFDLSHFNYIIYEESNLPELQSKLRKRVLAMQEQILRAPSMT